MKLYYHRTDGGAEYLCSENIEGTDEGSLYSKYIVRIDGDIRQHAELFIKDQAIYKNLTRVDMVDALVEKDIECITDDPLSIEASLRCGVTGYDNLLDEELIEEYKAYCGDESGFIPFLSPINDLQLSDEDLEDKACDRCGQSMSDDRYTQNKGLCADCIKEIN